MNLYHLNIDQSWLNECREYVKQNARPEQVEEGIWNQILYSDLKEMASKSHFSDTTKRFESSDKGYLVQIEDIMEIGQSKLNTLNQLQNEQYSKNTLKITFTDGIESFIGFEETRTCLTLDLKLGCKVALYNVEMMNNVAFICNENIKILGGFVPELNQDSRRLEKRLLEVLGKKDKINNVKMRETELLLHENQEIHEILNENQENQEIEAILHENQENQQIETILNDNQEIQEIETILNDNQEIETILRENPEINQLEIENEELLVQQQIQDDLDADISNLIDFDQDIDDCILPDEKKLKLQVKLCDLKNQTPNSIVWVEANLNSMNKISVSKDFGIWTSAILKDDKSECRILLNNEFISKQIGLNVQQLQQLRQSKTGQIELRQVMKL